jgi:hypothetical protein
VLAIGGELALFAHLREFSTPRASFIAMMVPLGLFALAWFAHHRRGERFSTPLLVLTGVGALLATALGLEDRIDRIVNLLAIAGMAGLAAVYLKRPWLMYVAGSALMGANLAAMLGTTMPATHIVIEMLAFALAQAVATRAIGGKAAAYARPFFIIALIGGVMSLAFGVTQSGRYVGDPKECQIAIGGMLLSAALFGVAGRAERKPALYYLAAINVLGAYYLGLHWLTLRGTSVAIEAYTAPVGAVMMLWSAYILRDRADRGATPLAEALAVGVMTLPSIIVSFAADQGWHALLLYGLALLVICGGMMFRRRAYLIGGTAAMVVETGGKAVQFLVDRGTSAAEWGMIIGGFIILLAALFESRKAAFVKQRLEAVQLGARRYFADWK